MDYSQGQLTSNQIYSAGSCAPLGGLQGAQMKAPAPRTISSAIGRMDNLNGRLSEVCKQLSGISDSIGGPRPLNAEAGKDHVPSGDVVGRLNDSADCAHDYMGEIENLLGAIARSLG